MSLSDDGLEEFHVNSKLLNDYSTITQQLLEHQHVSDIIRCTAWRRLKCKKRAN